MSIYRYTIKDTKTGAKSSGCIRADDVDQALRRAKKFITPTEIITDCYEMNR